MGIDEEFMEEKEVIIEKDDQSNDEIVEEVEKKSKKKSKKEPKKDKKQEEIDSLKRQVAEKQDQYIRVAAELDNFRKRSAKENQDKLKFANQQIITSLLTVMDHLDMAIAHITPDSSLETLQQGVELTLKQFMDVFEKHGVKEIDVTVGEQFDPSNHEAMMLANNPEMENNSVTMVMQKGFTLNSRVIRPSKVQVNKYETGNNQTNIEEDSNEQ